jgi:pyruvate dehydrogenase E1 component
VQQCLPGDAPIVAATDYVRAWPQLVAGYVSAPFTALGTDGFGRSDTRAALREFFEVDRHQIVLAALSALRAQGRVDADDCAAAIARYGIATAEDAPWRR